MLFEYFYAEYLLPGFDREFNINLLHIDQLKTVFQTIWRLVTICVFAAYPNYWEYGNCMKLLRLYEIIFKR